MFACGVDPVVNCMSDNSYCWFFSHFFTCNIQKKLDLMNSHRIINFHNFFENSLWKLWGQTCSIRDSNAIWLAWKRKSSEALLRANWRDIRHYYRDMRYCQWRIEKFQHLFTRFTRFTIKGIWDLSSAFGREPDDSAYHNSSSFIGQSQRKQSKWPENRAYLVLLVTQARAQAKVQGKKCLQTL